MFINLNLYAGGPQKIHQSYHQANRPELCGNCAFTQNFHNRKSGEITVFFAACNYGNKRNEPLTSRNDFLSNFENKKAVVKSLAAELRTLGFQVFGCPCNADTKRVKTALEYLKKQPVILYADDTDILSLLLHHSHNIPDLQHIFLTEMTKKSDHQQHKCYSIRKVISQLIKREEPKLPCILLAHAFTGCDTTFIFKKLKNSKRPRNIADIFYKDGQNP